VEWSVTTRSPCCPSGSGLSSSAFTIVKTIDGRPDPEPERRECYERESPAGARAAAPRGRRSS
jgi:hypothetical protein